MQTANYTCNGTKTTITFNEKCVKYKYIDEDGFTFVSSVNQYDVPDNVGGLSNFYQMICKSNITRTDTNMIVSTIDNKCINISFVCKYGELLFEFDVVLEFLDSIINYGNLDYYMRKLFPSDLFGRNLTYECKIDVIKHFAVFKQIDKRFTFAFLHKIFQTSIGTYFDINCQYTEFYIAENERRVVLDELLNGLHRLVNNEKQPLTALDEICKKYE
jgi:hypothetical protein